ncbi:MAG TPA: hypothetical protein VF271_06415 [Rhodanobacteraceae bacterium]
MITTSSTFKDSKAHFLILDALRGVAAIVVVLFHIMEVYCGLETLRRTGAPLAGEKVSAHRLAPHPAGRDRAVTAGQA